MAFPLVFTELPFISVVALFDFSSDDMDDRDCLLDPFDEILVIMVGGSLVRLMKPTHQSKEA